MFMNSMNRLFRTFFIFLLLLSTRTGFAATYEPQNNVKEKSDNYAVRQSLTKNLTGLVSISSLQNQIPRQTSSDLATLYTQAQPAQDELNVIMQTIADNTHSSPLLPPIKSYARAQEKMITKFDGDASQLTDLARATLVTNNIHALMQAYESLSTQTQIVQVKNRFASPKESGYRDLNVLIRLPESQMIAEVQLHLEEIAKIKSGAEHLVYEEVQAIQSIAKNENRQLNEIETAHIKRMRQASHKQYHKAWLQYKRIDEAGIITAVAA